MIEWFSLALAQEKPLPPLQIWSAMFSGRLARVVGFTLAMVAAGPTYAIGAAAPEPSLDCAYRPPAAWQQALDDARRRGEISVRSAPVLLPSSAAAVCDSVEYIFAHEDTGQVLLSDFSDGQLLDLMTEAANALITAHGDNFDFIGYWLNFVPHHKVGTAFYQPVENDVTGIGDPSTVGNPIFNSRPAMGLAGDHIEGFVMMWNINDGFWAGGSGPGADFTRLVLGQEFAHRFGMYLPSITGGRSLQGNNGNCGRGFHWNFKVDGQGSSMEISEWVGTGPATRFGGSINYNMDITGGVWSYSDLYLMGYVSPAEMDAGNSELRYMKTSDCSSPYSGQISSFSSAEIIAAAGPRVPSSTAAQQDFRTGWVMIHLPGDPPDAAEITKAVGILQQQSLDWNQSTLGRGTLDNALCRPVVTSVESNPRTPARLLDVWPNPTAGNRVRIAFRVPGSNGAKLEIFDVTGRRVRAWNDAFMDSGLVMWDGRDMRGDRVSSGIYYIRLIAENHRETRTVTWIRN